MRKLLSEIPLVWGVEPNALEQEYIKWVSTLSCVGNFLVTWPWDVVKFVPILLTEYLLGNQKRVIVIDKPVNNSPKNSYLMEPNIFESFEQTIFSGDLPITGDFEKNIRSELKKVDRSLLVKLGVVVECEAKEVGSGKWTKYDCEESYVKCRNKVRKEYESLYGLDCIRKMTENRLKKDKVTRLYNNDGRIDLKFTEIKKYIGKVDYDIKWLWDILTGLNSIRNPSRIIPVAAFPELSSLPHNNNKRLIFINDDEHPARIFDFIKDVSPELVVIPNADEFISDRIFGGPKSYNLIKYLQENRTSIVLMFSTNKDLRHLYKLYDEPVGEGCKVTPHTIDNYAILKYLRENLNKNDSRYPNPLSSRWNELPVEMENTPDVKYVIVKDMGRLDEISLIVNTIQNESLRKDLKRFVDELQRTLLKLKGPPYLPEVFKRGGNSIELLSYENVMNTIADRIDNENRKKIDNVLSSVFSSINGEEKNPLRDSVVETVNELLKTTDVFISLVVNGYEVKGVQVLFEKIPLYAASVSRLKFTTWKDLKKMESQIPWGKSHYVIATSYPGLSYSMYKSKIDKFIFIGTETSLKKIRRVVEYRINEFISRPLFVLSSGKCAPQILKEATNNIGQIGEEQISDLLDDIVFEDQHSIKSEGNIEAHIGSSYYGKIKAGDEAILVIGPDNRGMLIPTGASVTIKENDHLAEIYLGNIHSGDYGRKLIESEILLDVTGFYRSFRSMFINYMLKYASRIIFRKGGYEWKGFRGLLESTQKWILALSETVKRYSEINKIEYSDAENMFSKYLSGLNLNAKNPMYIKRWWSDFETLTIDNEEFYIYDIEHTKSIQDVQKVFNGINELIPEMKLNIKDGEESYIASVFMQDFRRTILSGKDLDPKLKHIYEAVSKDIGEVVKQSQFFKVSSAYKVKISEEVDQFRVLTNYSQFIDRDYG